MSVDAVVALMLNACINSSMQSRLFSCGFFLAQVDGWTGSDTGLSGSIAFERSHCTSEPRSCSRKGEFRFLKRPETSRWPDQEDEFGFDKCTRDGPKSVAVVAVVWVITCVENKNNTFG